MQLGLAAFLSLVKLLTPDYHVSLGERVSVAEICETAKRLEMTMVGLCKGGPLSHMLAPPASLEIEICPGDKIIAVADLVN